MPRVDAAGSGWCLRGLPCAWSLLTMASWLFRRTFSALARMRSRTVWPDLRELEEKAEVLWVDAFSVCCWLMDRWADSLMLPSSAWDPAPVAVDVAPSMIEDRETSSLDGLTGALF